MKYYEGFLAKHALRPQRSACQATPFFRHRLLAVPFWRFAVCLWHRHDRPEVAATELHCTWDSVGGFELCVVLSVVRVTPLPPPRSIEDELRSVFGSDTEAEDGGLELQAQADWPVVLVDPEEVD